MRSSHPPGWYCIPMGNDFVPSNPMLKIAVLSNLWPDALDQLQKQFDCEVVINPPADRKMKILEEVEIVIVRSPVVLDRAALESARSLRLIVRAGAGVELIDTVFARERGMQLVTVPLSADSVAEHAFGLLLSLSRRIPWLNQRLRQGHWEKHSGFGNELRGKTLGLIGFGRIGIRLAEISAAFGMNVLAHDRSPEKPAKKRAAANGDVRFADLEEVFSESDLLSVQVPLSENSRGMVGAAQIQLMRRHALIVNVGRGEVVDEHALFEALSGNRIAGAAADVFSVEPPGKSPLLTLDNFVATPHVGAQTVEAQQKVGRDVVRIVQEYAGRAR